MIKKYKPLRTIQMYYFIIYYCFLLPFDIGATIVLHEYFPIKHGLIAAIIVHLMLLFLIWLLIRLVFNQKYIIDEEHIIKYKGKRVVFKIKKNNIKRIYIKKAPWYDFFAFLHEAFRCVDSHGTVLSFAFKECELVEYEKNADIPRHPIKPRYEDQALLEYVEIMPLKQSLKICEDLNIEPIIV